MRGKEMIVLQRALDGEMWYELGLTGELKPFISVLSVAATVDASDKSPSVTTCSEAVEPGVWCHLAASFGQAGLQLFVNGEVTTTMPNLEHVFETKIE